MEDACLNWVGFGLDRIGAVGLWVEALVRRSSVLDWRPTVLPLEVGAAGGGREQKSVLDGLLGLP